MNGRMKLKTKYYWHANMPNQPKNKHSILAWCYIIITNQTENHRDDDKGHHHPLHLLWMDQWAFKTYNQHHQNNQAHHCRGTTGYRQPRPFVNQEKWAIGKVEHQLHADKSTLWWAHHEFSKRRMASAGSYQQRQCTAQWWTMNYSNCSIIQIQCRFLCSICWSRGYCSKNDRRGCHQSQPIHSWMSHHITKYKTLHHPWDGLVWLHRQCTHHQECTCWIHGTDPPMQDATTTLSSHHHNGLQEWIYLISHTAWHEQISLSCNYYVTLQQGSQKI